MRLFPRLILISTLLFFLSGKTSNSQSHTARPNSINSVCGGYYEYLPSGYNPAQPHKYPLIIFLHGLGDSGDGKLPQLNRVLLSGLPVYIENGQFPTAFTVSGVEHRFIVISPQFSQWPTADDIQDVIDYILPKYKVDESRIYLTGLSMGGGATWDYAQSHLDAASSVAAIVPVCGASDPSAGTPHVIAQTHLPVWATHNDGDPDVPVSNTHGFVSAINSHTPTTNALARKTIFNSNAHDAWSETYDPNFRENGHNIYEWMLQHTREFSSLPVTLTSYSAQVKSEKLVVIDWATSQEDNNDRFVVEHSADGRTFHHAGEVKGINSPAGSQYSFNHTTPLPGSNFYRLKQIDRDGRTTVYKILKVTLFPGLSSVKVFPNPSTGQLNVALSNNTSGNIQLSILDYSGKLVVQKVFNKPLDYWQQSVNTSHLTRGQYILKLEAPNYTTTTKFVKQ